MKLFGRSDLGRIRLGGDQNNICKGRRRGEDRLKEKSQWTKGLGIRGLNFNLKALRRGTHPLQSEGRGDPTKRNYVGLKGGR